MKKLLMKNDPRLTAYALGELPLAEAEEIAQMLENQPELQQEVDDINVFGSMLSDTFGSKNALKLKPEQRNTVYRSSQYVTAEDVPSGYKKQWLRPLVVLLGAAAVVTLTFTWLSNMAGRPDPSALSFERINDKDLVAPVIPNQSDWKKSNNGASNAASNGGNTLFNHSSGTVVQDMQDGLKNHPLKLRNRINEVASKLDPETLEFVELNENAWIKRGEKSMTRLPLVSGNSSWEWLEQWSENTTQKLDKNAVRIEEILNHFSYSQPSDVQIGSLQTGVALIQCPWNKNHQVAVILVQNNGKKAVTVEAAIAMNESVQQYRLLGYAPSANPEESKMAPALITMPAGYSHLIIYEIALGENVALGDDVLSLTINTGNSAKELLANNTLSVQFSDLPVDEAHQDVQFSLILANWSQFMTDSKNKGNATKESVSKLMTEYQSNFELSAEQQEAFQVITRSLKQETK